MVMYKGRKHKLHKGPRKGYYIIINKKKRYIKNYGKKKVMKGGEMRWDQIRLKNSNGIPIRYTIDGDPEHDPVHDAICIEKYDDQHKFVKMRFEEGDPPQKMEEDILIGSITKQSSSQALRPRPLTKHPRLQQKTAKKDVSEKTRGTGPLIETLVAYRGGTKVDKAVLELYHKALEECGGTHKNLTFGGTGICKWSCKDHRDIKPAYRPLGKRSDISSEQVAMLRTRLEVFMAANKCEGADREEVRVGMLKKLLEKAQYDDGETEVPVLGEIAKFPFKEDAFKMLKDLVIKLRVMRRIGLLSEPLNKWSELTYTEFDILLSSNFPTFKEKVKEDYGCDEIIVQIIDMELEDWVREQKLSENSVEERLRRIREFAEQEIHKEVRSYKLLDVPEVQNNDKLKVGDMLVAEPIPPSADEGLDTSREVGGPTHICRLAPTAIMVKDQTFIEGDPDKNRWMLGEETRLNTRAIMKAKIACRAKTAQFTLDTLQKYATQLKLKYNTRTGITEDIKAAIEKDAIERDSAVLAAQKLVIDDLLMLSWEMCIDNPKSCPLLCNDENYKLIWLAYIEAACSDTHAYNSTMLKDRDNGQRASYFGGTRDLPWGILFIPPDDERLTHRERHPGGYGLDTWENWRREWRDTYEQGEFDETDINEETTTTNVWQLRPIVLKHTSQDSLIEIVVNLNTELKRLKKLLIEQGLIGESKMMEIRDVNNNEIDTDNMRNLGRAIESSGRNVFIKLKAPPEMALGLPGIELGDEVSRIPRAIGSISKISECGFPNGETQFLIDKVIALQGMCETEFGARNLKQERAIKAGALRNTTSLTTAVNTQEDYATMVAQYEDDVFVPRQIAIFDTTVLKLRAVHVGDNKFLPVASQGNPISFQAMILDTTYREMNQNSSGADLALEQLRIAISKTDSIINRAIDEGVFLTGLGILVFEIYKNRSDLYTMIYGFFRKQDTRNHHSESEIFPQDEFKKIMNDLKKNYTQIIRLIVDSRKKNYKTRTPMNHAALAIQEEEFKIFHIMAYYKGELTLRQLTDREDPANAPMSARTKCCFSSAPAPFDLNQPNSESTVVEEQLNYRDPIKMSSRDRNAKIAAEQEVHGGEGEEGLRNSAIMAFNKEYCDAYALWNGIFTCCKRTEEKCITQMKVHGWKDADWTMSEKNHLEIPVWYKKDYYLNFEKLKQRSVKDLRKMWQDKGWKTDSGVDR